MHPKRCSLARIAGPVRLKEQTGKRALSEEPPELRGEADTLRAMMSKKLRWSVLAVLTALAVTLGVMAFVTPRPYEFLKDAKFRSEQSRLRTVDLNGPVTMARTSFIVDESLTSFAVRVQEELPLQDGWDWEATTLEWERHFINDSKREWVSLYDASIVLPDSKGKTLVRIEHVASLSERVFLWFNGREGR